MRWPRSTAYVAIVLVAWAGLAAWQYDEYGHECELAQQVLERQAEALMNALVGGMRSHRRMGRFFPEQLQGVLDELADAEDILAAAVVSHNGKLVLTSGQTGLINTAAPIATGTFWDDGGLRYAVDFHLAPESPGGPGFGQGFGPGGGRGRGRGAGWRAEDPAAQSPLAAGGDFCAVLVLDRQPADRLQQRAWWLRVSVTMAGGLVLALLAVAWRTTVRWVEAAGRARVLENEARHLRELSQAAAGLAHETRNPLGLIRGWTQRLADAESSSPDLREKAQAVLEECDRVTARINQFLAFAKPNEPELTEVAPGSLIDELSALLEPDLEAKGLRIEQMRCGGVHRVEADREQLRQALFNLTSNAVHFSPRGAAIEIATKRGENGKVRIEVADRGPGVPPDKVESLFTPYFTTRPNGTGLGLAIVRRIAAAHGWESGYTPRPGGGSIFWLGPVKQ